MEYSKYINNFNFENLLNDTHKTLRFYVADCGAATVASALDVFEDIGGRLSDLVIEDVRAIFSLIRTATNESEQGIGFAQKPRDNFAAMKRTNYENLVRLGQALGSKEDTPAFEYFDPQRATYNARKAEKLVNKLLQRPEFHSFLKEWDDAENLPSEQDKVNKRVNLMVNQRYGLGSIMNEIHGYDTEFSVMEPKEDPKEPAMMHGTDVNSGQSRIYINPISRTIGISSDHIVSKLAHEYHHTEQSRDSRKENANWFLQAMQVLKITGSEDRAAYYGNLLELDAYHFGNCVRKELRKQLSEQHNQVKIQNQTPDHAIPLSLLGRLAGKAKA